MGDLATAVNSQQHARVFTEERLRNVFKYQEPEKPSIFHILRGKLKCSKSYVFGLLPVLEWLPKYDIKNNLLNDLLIAIIMVPMLVQMEVAYADIAKLPLVVGLYASIFPPIIYFFMGTSKHIAIGLSGVISLMIGNSVAKYANNPEFADEVYSPLQIAIGITFLSGCWLLLFGICRLGSICSVMSDSFTLAFYSSGGFHIIQGRLKTLLGLKYTRPPNFFYIFTNLYEMLKRIPETNLVTFGLSASVVTSNFLFTRFAKPFLDRKFPKARLPVFFDLILIILSTVLSYALDMHKNYDIDIVGNFPTGLPEIVIPPFEIFPKLMIDSLILAIVVMPLYIPLTKMLAKQHNYRINDNQELLTYGVINLVTGFLSCPLTGNSLGRSMIQNSFGGGSQLSNLFTSIFIFFIILFIGPVIEYIPICVLSAIILLRMSKYIFKVADFPKIYRKSKLDGAVWFITFASSVILDISYGTVIGMVACVVATLIPSQRTKVIVLGHVPGTDMFLDQNRFLSAVTSNRALILKVIGNIHFANSESVQDKILDQVKTCRNNCIRFVILNLSAVAYIDPTGVKSLLLVAEELKKKGNTTTVLFLTNCLPNVYKKLEDCDYFKVIPKFYVFASVKDAVESLNQIEDANGIYETKF